MTNYSIKIKSLCNLLLCLLPISLISGPALPDLSISLVSLFFIYLSLKNKQFQYSQFLILNIFFIWCLFLVLRSFFTNNILFSLETSLFYFRFGVLVLAIIFLIENNENFLKKFSIFICISLFIVSFDGIFQFFFKFNLFGFSMPDLSNYRGRISGFFREELIMGSYLSRLLPLSLGLLIYVFSNNKNIKTIIYFFITIISIAIFISGERSAFFYCILSNIIFLILFKKYKIQIFYSIITSIFVIYFLIQFNPHTQYRMFKFTIDQITNLSQQENYYIAGEGEESKLVLNEKYDDSKFEIQRFRLFSSEYEHLFLKSIKIFSHNKLFGIGPKMFRKDCSKELYDISKDKNFILGCANHPHNLYLQILVETGIIGTLPIILFFFYICYLFFYIIVSKIINTKHEYDDTKICMLVSVLISIWPFIPTGSFFNNWLSAINFLSLSLFYFFFYKKNNEIIIH